MNPNINPKTSWTSPKRNLIAGIICLKAALSSGRKARLIRLFNEECMFPIKIENSTKDFRNYEFSIGYPESAERIQGNTTYSDFEKHLSLNYISVFGTPEAIKTYYETGVLSSGNVQSMGRNHLVAVDDYINYLVSIKDFQRADMYERQYRNENTKSQSFFYDFYKPLHGNNRYEAKHFKNKLYVVELLDKNNTDKQPIKVSIIMSIITMLCYPLKYIPQKDVLLMDNYKLVTFRIGAVVNGFAIEFHIPKKFSFKRNN
jgi:hypothetical protein